MKIQIPGHVAMILDGNGRWAKRKGKAVSYGHRKGTENLETILEYADELGIKIITLYAFSKENWQRSAPEKRFLFKLLVEFFEKKITKIINRGSRIVIIGDKSKFSKNVQNVLDNAEKKSKKNTKTLIQIALSYGGRDELTRACKKIVSKSINDYQNGVDEKRILKSINEQTVSNHLDTAGQEDPDLLIRTGGDLRISNFLIYQCAYSEFYFTKILWPDFTKNDFLKAIEDYSGRQRRYGRRP